MGVLFNIICTWVRNFSRTFEFDFFSYFRNAMIKKTFALCSEMNEIPVRKKCSTILNDSDLISTKLRPTVSLFLNCPPLRNGKQV